VKKLILSSLLASALVVPAAAKADFINIFDIAYSGSLADIRPESLNYTQFNGAGTFSFNTPLTDLTHAVDSFVSSPVLNFDYEASFWFDNDKDNPFFSFKLSDWLNGTNCSGATTCPTASLSFYDFTLLQQDPTGKGQSDAYFFSNSAPAGGDFPQSFGLTVESLNFGSLFIQHSTSFSKVDPFNDDFYLSMALNEPLTQGAPVMILTEAASYSMKLREPTTGTPTDPTAPTNPTDPTEVPEPTAWALMLAGMAFILGRRRLS
jgi:hypothetical protein